MQNSRLISVLRPELKIYFKHEEDFYKYKICSDARIDVKCPSCGHEHVMIVKNLTRRHYSCPVCKSKKSFPERIMLAILDQLKIRYIYQLNKKNFLWCNNFIYDFYLVDYNLIIEINGSQHYYNQFNHRNAKTLEETIRNDNIKKELAEKNGFDLIYVNCSNLLNWKSEYETSLNNILDLSNIDWTQVFITASDSTIYDICKYWEQNKHIFNTVDVAKHFNVTRDYVVRVLHRGSLTGLCEYDGIQERKRASKKGVLIKSLNYKQIYVFNLNNVLIKVYNNINLAVNNFYEDFGVNVNKQCIYMCCRGKIKTHKKYKFRYDSNI